MAAFEEKDIREMSFPKEQFWNWLRNNVPNGILDNYAYVDLDMSWFFVEDPDDTSRVVVRKLKVNV